MSAEVVTPSSARDAITRDRPAADTTEHDGRTSRDRSAPDATERDARTSRDRSAPDATERDARTSRDRGARTANGGDAWATNGRDTGADDAAAAKGSARLTATAGRARSAGDHSAAHAASSAPTAASGSPPGETIADGAAAVGSEAPPAASAPPRRALGPWSRRIVGALAEVVLPTGSDAPTMPTADVVRFVDEYVPHMPRLLALLFPVGLLLLELGAFVLGPSLVPFSAMSLARRRRFVATWVHARWRLRRDLIKAVKGLCLIAYYSDPRVGARLGYAVDEHVATVSAERLRRHARDL